MTTYSDADLEALLADLESQLVERKPSATDGQGIRRNICAFANDLPGYARAGVVFVGVDDRGAPNDLPIDDRLLRNLAQMRDDGNLLPPPSLGVEVRTLRGARLAVVFVEPSSSPPVRYKGRVYVKVGPTTRPATEEEEQRLAERRRSGDRSFDMRPAVGADLGALDLEYIRMHYLPRAVAIDVLEQNHRPLEQQLRSLRLLAGNLPTHGALLGFANDPRAWIPGAYVQFLRLDGTKVTDPIRDQKVLTGRLEDVLRRLEELLELNVATRTVVDTASREIRRPDYPVLALKQFAHNAVMHRSYEGTNAPAHVYWYADRIEIRSPGGLYGKVTPENFGTGAVEYRNPLVAEIMHHLGFAQRFGLGVPLARESLAKNGNPAPVFDFQPTMVQVTVRPAP
ncbi:MAG: transcriptional regulator [Planctomycetes bacterium]|nr:transcriptional regulator [Planctomycetota bacterium]